MKRLAPVCSRTTLLGALLTLSHFAPSPLAMASESPQLIQGWPLGDTSLSQSMMNQDAIMGTYVCPALTRLNLERRQNETVLLSELSANGTEWKLSLKKGLVWWSGRKATGADLEAFVRDSLPEAVREMGKGRWTIPAYTSKVEGDTLALKWATAPSFGPYVFNRIPFTVRDGADTMCVGELKPFQEKGQIRLEGQLAGKSRTLLLASADDKQKPWLSFRFGNEMHPAGWERQIEEGLKCPSQVDMPLISLIAWNPEGRLSGQASFRRAMTHLLPRGALLRAGAGSLGDLISAPILRAHPGYKRSILVWPYDLKKAETMLNGLGLVRSETDGYRRDSKGEVVQLTIATDNRTDSGLLRKVLDDSFRALGMRLLITNDSKQADGILTAVSVSWPDNDLSDFLHSQSDSKAWPWTYRSVSLDAALDAYSLSLTQTKPDFRLLETVHERFAAEEPFSVLVQHKSCMEYAGGKPAGTLQAISNPDWIRRHLER